MKTSDPNGRLYEADKALSGVVSHYYHLFNAADAAPVKKNVSPNLEMLLVLNFGPPISFAFHGEIAGAYNVQRLAIIGPVRKMISYQLPPNANAIVVNLMLDGFYRLFNTPLNQLAGNEMFDPAHSPAFQQLNEIWFKLSQIPGITESVQRLNEALLSLITDNEEAVKPLLAGERYFFDQFIQPVKAIAADTGLTERSIQLRFQKYAGYSPKELLRFLRFKGVITQIMKQPAQHIEIFDLIETFNYHDQSHLIKDFKYFLGVSPQQFIKKLRNQEFYLNGHDKLI